MTDVNPSTQALIGRINQKLDTLGQRADSLQTLSQRNQQALVDPAGPLMTAINGVRQRIAGLQQGIQQIVTSKTALERLVNETDVNLGALEQRLNDTIQEIDVQPLIQQLQPLSEEIDRLAAMINAANDAPMPPGDRPPRPGNRPAARPPPGAGDQGQNPQGGGYVIPKFKRRSVGRRTYKKSSSSGHRRSQKKRRSTSRRTKGGNKTKNH
jgi:uncharacterized phage infection (PIP) family protein YhgE